MKQRSATLARLLLGINIPVYFAVGIPAIVAPQWLAAQMDIDLTTATAICDFSAMYGGLSCGAGLAMLLGLRSQARLRPAVALSAILAGGLALGRIYAWITAGTPSTLMLLTLGTELVACVGALGLLPKLAPPPAAEAAGMGRPSATALSAS